MRRTQKQKNRRSSISEPDDSATSGIHAPTASAPSLPSIAEDNETLVETLRIRQLELEMQNRELRSAQIALEELRDRYYDLYNLSPVGYITADLTGHILEVNLTMGEMVGTDPSTLLQRPVTELFSSADERTLNDKFRNVPGRAERAPIVVELQRRVGPPLSVLVDRVGVREGGDIQTVRFAVTDLSKLKALESVRQNVKEKYHQVFQQLKTAILLYAVDTRRFLEVNEAASRLFGYPADQFSGLTLDNLTVHHLTVDAERMVSAGEGGTIRYLRRRDGQVFPAECSEGEYMLGDQRIGFVMIRDISDLVVDRRAIRNSQEHYQKLFFDARKMQEKLQNHAMGNLRAVEEERRRISRELHDEIGQALTAMNINLEVLKREVHGSRALTHLIEQTEVLAEQTIRNLHDISQWLRPAALDELGIVPALKAHVRAFRKRTGIHTSFRTGPGLEHIGVEEQIVLYRIAQECLNNIVKHAAATQVSVTLVCREGFLVLEIADNGVGMPADPIPSDTPARGGLGLIGMKERVRLVNGLLFVGSRRGGGTVIRVEIPQSPSSIHNGE